MIHEVIKVGKGDGAKTHDVHIYDDFYECMQHCKDIRRQENEGGYGPDCAGQLNSRTSSRGYDWTFGVDWDSSIRLLESGWPEGVERAEKMSADIMTVQGGHRLQDVLIHDTQGPICDTGAFIEGVPECMCYLGQEVRPGAGKVIDVLIDLSTSWGVAGEKMALRGAAHIALVTALEQAGFKCTISVCHGSFSLSGHSILEVIKVQDTQSVADLDRIAYVVAHPAFFRRQCFSLAEQHGKEIRKTCGVIHDGGYGRPRSLTEITDRYDMYTGPLSSYDSEFGDIASCAAWVNEKLKEYGAVVEAL